MVAGDRHVRGAGGSSQGPVAVGPLPWDCPREHAVHGVSGLARGTRKHVHLARDPTQTRQKATMINVAEALQSGVSFLHSPEGKKAWTYAAGTSKPHSRKKGTLVIKGLLRNLDLHSTNRQTGTQNYLQPKSHML